MLDRLGPDAELHVIDPSPEFDPAEHERRFPGRYIFHRDLSLNVLPQLAPVDVALVDGDHNWYTVFHELKQLAATASAAGAQLPVLVMHDVCWPYGRRDLYYAPETIPEEFRQPYAQQGMRMDRKKLLPRGGLNPTMYNALEEGGPRNGVMTALDDFEREHGRPLRRVVIPIYFGLAIVAEQERLERHPRLAELLDRLESADGRAQLLELAEDVRLKAMLFQHNVFYANERKLERAATRYLELLKGALLDEHYIDNELRMDHLVDCLERNRVPEEPKLRDPIRFMRDQTRAIEATLRAGTQADRDGVGKRYFPYTAMGRVRLDHLQRCLDTIRADSVPGDLVACGTDRGGDAMLMRGYLEAYELPDRQVWVADELRSTTHGDDGASSRVPGGGRGLPRFRGDLNQVREGFERFGLLDERVRFLVGSAAETLPDAPIEQVALLRIGPELGDLAGEVVDAVYDKIAIGGTVVVDGYRDPALRDGVEELRARRGIDEGLERVDAEAVCWRKTREALPQKRRWLRRGRAAHPPLAPSVTHAATAPVDLSIVVVFYNMRREAERTLHSLSRAYQRGVDDVDYEVIVVENGSDEDQRLGDAFVRSFGPEFRYVDMGKEAVPSPVPALNRGISQSRGNALALMIDGAHVVTPGVLRYGMAALATYEPALVMTQQWYVGPGQQPDAMIAGYDQDFEDRLFKEIEWPLDGYRLFDISHFIGDRDWFDGVWESNCVFVRRALLEQVGGFDEAFSMPGGGYANLELYERLGNTPGLHVATILGEGSFHQVHGGTTTNEDDADERRRRVAGYARGYEELRGRGFRGPGKPLHYIGGMPPGARRTKARRRTAVNLFKAGAGDPDGLPERPTPIPDELAAEFTDALWRSLAWRDSTWLGHEIETLPTDLIAYQEILTRVRPEWVVDIRTGNGARALFLASVCELLGRGRVVSVDSKPRDDRPQHPRITYVTGEPMDDDTVREVHDIVGASPNAVLLLGARGTRQRILKELQAYEALVPLGSYVVIEDTIVNGHPVWPTFGAGPAEAIKTVINTRGDLAPDPTLQRYGVTFNPNGFLKRLR
jgi:cephalosporin hydroxylase